MLNSLFRQGFGIAPLGLNKPVPNLMPAKCLRSFDRYDWGYLGMLRTGV